MPGYRTHLGGGVASAVILYCVLPIPPVLLERIIECFVCALAGSLFPDVDTKSKGQKYFYSVLAVVAVVLLYARHYRVVAFVSVASFVPLLVPHRGLLHRAWFVAGVPLALYGWYVLTTGTVSYRLWHDTVFFIAGALSHLYLDLGFKRMWRF